jgi:hypothetical protein
MVLLLLLLHTSMRELLLQCCLQGAGALLPSILCCCLGKQPGQVPVQAWGGLNPGADERATRAGSDYWSAVLLLLLQTY